MTKIWVELRSWANMVSHNLDPEAHGLPHFLRLLPIPWHLAGTWVEVVAPDIVVDAAVTASPWVLILQEADNPCCKLTEELDGEDKRYDRNSNSTCNKHKGCTEDQSLSADWLLRKYLVWVALLNVIDILWQILFLLDKCSAAKFKSARLQTDEYRVK